MKISVNDKKSSKSFENINKSVFHFPITTFLYKSSKKIVYGEKTLYLCGFNLNILLWNQKAYQM